MIHFILPADPLKTTVIDEMFSDQAVALRERGFSVSSCPDSVVDDAASLRGIPSGATVVYRGWMLNAERYGRLAAAIIAAGGVPFTDEAAYLAAHHLPRWYPLIAELTPETRVLPRDADLASELRRLGWGTFFVKDYVKSLKTSRGAVIADPSEIDELVAEMARIRGEIEGGICVRRMEPFVAGTERRYFVLRARAYSPNGEEPPELVTEVAARIPSPFFSVDIVRREDGVARVVEIGDGQVSDLVGWSPNRFAEIWASA